MVAMDPSMNLRGQLSFSWMKLLTRSGFGKSKITGNGEVMLAPSSLGSIGVIRVNTVEPNPVKDRDPPFTSEWKVGRDAFLAATHAVDSDYQTQNLLQAVFSGEGFFVYTFRGWGPLFVQGLGGIVEKEVCCRALHGLCEATRTNMLMVYRSRMVKHLQSTMVTW